MMMKINKVEFNLNSEISKKGFRCKAPILLCLDIMV